MTSHGDLASAILRSIGYERETRAAETLERYRAFERREEIPRLALAAALSGALQSCAALEATRRWASQDAGTYVLSGPVGTGKTVAAARWAFAVSARWVSACDLGMASHTEARAMVKELRGVGALVIDEAGGPGATGPAALERVAALVSLRHGDGRRTLLTTNLDPETFAQQFDGVPACDSRILDRIRERGEWTTCDGPSLRGHGPQVQGGIEPIERLERLVQVCEDLRAIERSQATGLPTPEVIVSGIQLAGLEVDALEDAIEDDQVIRKRTIGLASEFVSSLAASKTLGGDQ